MTTLVLIASLLVLVALAAAAKARPQHGTAAPRVASHYHTRPALKHSPRFLVARALNRGLASTPMRTLGFELEAAGFRYHVHPAFIAAVAGMESSFGLRMCLDFNAWGISSCGNAWTAPTFRSWHEGIAYAAKYFRDRFAGARTPYDIHGYCKTRSGADCPTWPGKVAAFMRQLGFDSEIRYGAVSAVA